MLVRPAVLALVALYGGGLLAWAVLRTTPVGGWSLFELADVFGLALYVPLAPLTLLVVLLGDRRAATWLLAPLILFALDYGPLFLPRRPPDGGIPLRVMTSNLLLSNDDDAAFAAALVRHRPDVVALQELNPTMAERLAEALRDAYPYQRLDPDASTLGMGILSRHPIRDSSPPEMAPGGCFCQRATVDLAGRALRVVNAHPFPPRIAQTRWWRLPIPTDFDADEQRRVVQAILDAEATDNPLLVLGDFNVADRQPAYRALRGRLRDAHADGGRGFGFTFPSARVEGLPLHPFLRIDYIFHDDAWATRAAWTGDLPRSDHRFVVADLVLR